MEKYGCFAVRNPFPELFFWRYFFRNGVEFAIAQCYNKTVNWSTMDCELKIL